jgi:hypothetical protein
MTRDPIQEYYDYARRAKRRERWRVFLTIILATVAAWAILIIVLGMLAFLFVTFG